MLARKRGSYLKSYRILKDKEDDQHEKVESINSTQSHITQQSITPGKEKEEQEWNTVKQWLSDRLKDKIQRAFNISLHTHKPILLFRESIEENETAIEEKIGYISGNHIVCMVYTYGGFIPSTFHSIDVFTRDKFTKWIVQESKKDLLLQCIEELEQQK